MPGSPSLSRRTLLIGLIVASAIAASAAGIAALRTRSADVKPPPVAKAPALEFVPDDLHLVTSGQLMRTLPVTGTLMALTTATVKAKVAGELVEVAAREGQSVQKGQRLARIDQTEVQAKVAARSADVEAARAQLKLAEKNRSTQKALLDKNFISQNAFDTTQSGYDVAVARLRAAEADLLSASKTLGDSTLFAPFSGIVSERHAQPGERVPLDAKVISIVDLSVLTLEASVPASTVAQVKVGQAVSFRVDGFGERRFDGRIDRINPATAAGSRSISVYAVIENRDLLLRGGLFAQGELVMERIENATLVPATAVREEIGRTFVYAIDNGILRKKPVTVGQSDAAGMLQVLTGLAPGDRVVKSNLGQLRDGAAAQVRERAAAAAAPAK
jgi:membrane fusion protein (multidrug efflux system)